MTLAYLKEDEDGKKRMKGKKKIKKIRATVGISGGHYGCLQVCFLLTNLSASIL